MNIYELIIISIGLAMDAFAVSICKGLSFNKLTLKNAFIIAWYFGLFQALMPVLGYVLGNSFGSFVTIYDHWIAFILLSLIGLNMIKESLDNESHKRNSSVDFSTMIILAVATSIDAFAVGITFAIFKVNLLIAVLFIGFITFFVSLLGVKIGNSFGDKYERKAEFMGGFILIVLGLKILFEHLNIF